MTKVEATGSVEVRERADDEIDVTQEMIRAGARILSQDYDQPLDWVTEERARRVFLAMVEASRA